MTHIEIFKNIEEETCAYLFDYKKRNPVDMDVQVIKINLAGDA